jgi:histidine triad (HIT) family protein
MAACTFCAIVAGELPAAVVHADEHTVGFLDRRPLFHGHVLLVPRVHVETLPDLAPDHVGTLFGVVQRLSRAVPAAMEAQGSFVAINNIVSQSVPHLHVHIVPRNRKDGLRGFFWPRTKYDDDEQMAGVAHRIQAMMSP